MVRIACNVCGSTETEQVYHADHLGYERCVKCGLVYRNPQPRFNDVATIYSDNYFEYEISNHENFFGLMKKGLADIRFDEISRKFIRRRVLDIGCATGLLLNHLKEQGWDSYGVEICHASAQYAIDTFDLKVYESKLEDVRFPGGFFDVVHLSHLVEHVMHPKSLIDEIYHVLMPGGYMILTTPNIDGIAAKLYGDDWRCVMDQHLYLFSKRTMKRLVEDAGFKVVQQLSWGSLPIEKNPSPFLKKITDRLVKLLNLGDVMLFLCEK
ncbi:MAG: class I SAM-dependent methyltransferase [Spirochaetes bacterium]|nr:class I SAM-dependent methyltransferase [Spirochaetota bacterium]